MDVGGQMEVAVSSMAQPSLESGEEASQEIPEGMPQWKALRWE